METHLHHYLLNLKHGCALIALALTRAHVHNDLMGDILHKGVIDKLSAAGGEHRVDGDAILFVNLLELSVVLRRLSKLGTTMRRNEIGVKATRDGMDGSGVAEAEKKRMRDVRNVHTRPTVRSAPQRYRAKPPNIYTSLTQNVEVKESDDDDDDDDDDNHGKGPG